MANNTGIFFNVNDNDGIPLVGVSTDGRVLLNHLYGNCLIGSTSATGTQSQPLQITGGSYFSGSVGIGTTNPTSKLDVIDGDIRVGINTSQGVILTSPNGTKFRLFVSDTGTLSTVLVS